MNNKEEKAETYRSYCDLDTKTSEYANSHIDCSWHADIINAEFQNPKCNYVRNNPIKTPEHRWRSYQKEQNWPVGATYLMGGKEWTPKQDTGTTFQMRSGGYEFIEFTDPRYDTVKYGPTGQPYTGYINPG